MKVSAYDDIDPPKESVGVLMPVVILAILMIHDSRAKKDFEIMDISSMMRYVYPRQKSCNFCQLSSLSGLLWL